MIECEFTTMEIDRGHYVREGKHVAILCFGTFLPNVLHAVEVQDATVVDMRFVKPLDEALIREPAAQHVLLVTVEENVIAGGAGAGGLNS